jgi:hypothetical protein
VEPARRKKEWKTQDYMAKHSEDGRRTSRGNWLEIKSLKKNRIRWRTFVKALCLSEG